jgi:hypothetical protein
MTQEETAKIIAEYLATKEGRDKLAAAMIGRPYNEPWRCMPDIEEDRRKK